MDVVSSDRATPVDDFELATEFAARGLRLLGVSRSAHRAPAVCSAGTRSAVVTSESVLDAVLSLVDAREPALA